MRLDITDLMTFYATPLGDCARRRIVERVNSLWGDLSGLDVLGIGYPTPFLSDLEGAPRRRIGVMPAGQGGHAWSPAEKGSTVVLSAEDRMPFPDAVFDRILIVHAMEETMHVPTFLREVWRIAAPEAKIILIAPNRAGVWSVSDQTPFGHGRPFSRRQMKRLMRDSLIEPTAWTRALYVPPVNWKIFTSSSEGWERAGEIFVANLGGVNLVEGIKRVQITPNQPEKARVVVPQATARAIKLN